MNLTTTPQDKASNMYTKGLETHLFNHSALEYKRMEYKICIYLRRTPVLRATPQGPRVSHVMG